MEIGIFPSLLGKYPLGSLKLCFPLQRESFNILKI